MNLSDVLTKFGPFFSGQNGVEALRNLILRLAFFGKFSDPDSGDNSINDLLVEARAEKAKLVRKQKDLVSADKSFISPLPKDWKWVQLDEVALDVQYGITESAQSSGNVRFLRITDIQKNDVNWDTVPFCDVNQKDKDSCLLAKRDILVARTGGTIGKSFLVRAVPVESVYASYLIRIRPVSCINEQFLKLFLETPLYWNQLRTKTMGTGQPNVNGTSLRSLNLPLPPLTEQRKIVDLVSELMKFLSHMDRAYENQLNANKRYFKTLFESQMEREKFESHIHSTFNELSLTVDNIESLKGFFLRSAFRGAICNDIPWKTSAQEILDKLKKKYPSKEKHETKVSTPKPYELPIGWAWSRFPELGIFGRGKSKHRPRNDPTLYTDGKYPMIQTGDVARSNGRVTTYTDLYNDVGLKQSRLWPKGTMCITIAANIADGGILDFDACFPDSVVGFIPDPSVDNVRYFEYFLRTMKTDLEAFAPSTAQKNINLEILESVNIPIAPFEVMQGIVLFLDNITQKCDQLAELILRKSELEARIANAASSQVN